MKPVGGRKNSGAVRLVVGKPGFHRHEAGWGTLDSVQPTIRSGIQIFNSRHSIKTKLRISPLSTDWTDRTPLYRLRLPKLAEWLAAAVDLLPESASEVDDVRQAIRKVRSVWKPAKNKSSGHSPGNGRSD